MAKTVGADPLGPLMRVRADQVLAAIRTDELAWDQIADRTGLPANVLESVIAWMSRRDELEELRRPTRWFCRCCRRKNRGRKNYKCPHCGCLRR